MSVVDFVALTKERERYIFFFTERDFGVLLHTLAKFAADPELSFTWHDAAVLAKQARNL